MPQQQAEYMTCTPLRINAKFLLHRGRRPYMSLSKDGRRRNGNRLRRLLGQLLEPAHDDVALEPRQEVDDQPAVEVVDLVLDDGRQQPFGGQLLLLALAVEEAHGR